MDQVVTGVAPEAAVTSDWTASATPAPRSRSGAAFPGVTPGLLPYHAQPTLQSLELLEAPAKVRRWGQTLSTWAMG